MTHRSKYSRITPDALRPSRSAFTRTASQRSSERRIARKGSLDISSLDSDTSPHNEPLTEVYRLLSGRFISRDFTAARDGDLDLAVNDVDLHAASSTPIVVGVQCGIPGPLQQRGSNLTRLLAVNLNDDRELRMVGCGADDCELTGCVDAEGSSSEIVEGVVTERGCGGGHLLAPIIQWVYTTLARRVYTRQVGLALSLYYRDDQITLHQGDEETHSL